MIDVAKVRADTPACENVLHFNNAGCALSPIQVQQAVIEHLNLEQEIGGYEAAGQAAQKIEGFYSSFACLLNCTPGEIAYLENATKAWHAAFHALGLQRGDHVLTGDMEYASNYLDLLHYARHKGIEITVSPSDDKGLLDLELLESAIKPNTKLICLTHVASQRGDIQPAEAVGKLTKDKGLFFLLDACQSAGQVPLDVEKIHCDFLCGTGRKYLRGPRGTGFLYARKSAIKAMVPAVIDLHSAQWTETNQYQLQASARRFENWERNVAACIGLATAVDYTLKLGVEEIHQRVSRLAARLHQQLEIQPDVEVLEKSEQLSGIVTFYKRGEQAEILQQRLQAEKINTSVSRVGNARLDLRQDVNRASLHYYNTEDEIDRFVEAVLTDQDARDS